MKEITQESVRRNKKMAWWLNAAAFLAIAAVIFLCVTWRNEPGNSQMISAALMIAYLLKYTEASCLRRCIPKE